MAIWQFDIQLIPSKVVAESPDRFEVIVDENGIDNTNWWLENQPCLDLNDLISSSFPPLDSWSTDLFRWGKEEGVLFEAFIENGKVNEILIRIDVRNLAHEQLKEMLKLIIALDCHIYIFDSEDVIAAEYNLLLEHLRKSRAMMLVEDPKGWLASLPVSGGSTGGKSAGNTESGLKGKAGICKRVFDFFTYISTGLLICVLLLLIASPWIDPDEHRISFSKDFHVSVGDRYLAFFNNSEYGLYRGSIIALDNNGVMPSIDEVSFGYRFGIYYRYFKWTETGDVLWTLLINMWYLLALFSVLPVTRFIRFKLRVLFKPGIDSEKV